MRRNTSRFEVTYTVNRGVRRTAYTNAPSAGKAINNVRFRVVGRKWADFVPLEVKEVG